MMKALARRPLRVKISLLMVLLLSAGLFVSSLIATTALRGYLTDRVDEAIGGGSRPFASASPAFPSVVVGVGTASPDFRPPSRFYIAAVYANGQATDVISVPDSTGVELPAIPAASDLSSLAGQPFTVGSVDAGPEWRVIVTPTAAGDGWIVVASSLADVQATVSRLVLLQLIVGVVVVIIAGVVGYWIVRRSLRPLDEMSSTAQTIADGDLSLRVPESGDGGEVDQLATSFNTMVMRIEESFAAQRASEVQARASEERMRQFVADASHELRTPLTSIRGYAELIEEGAATDSELAVERIQSEATRMGLLVDDLLMLARLDQHRPLVAEPVDVQDLVRDAVSGVLAGSPDRRIDIKLPAVGSVVVSGDRDRLRQVLDNLLSNALRYSSPEDPVEVTVSVESGWCAVAVADRGVGLTKDEAGQVFERLYRTDDARSRVRGGTGLGLAIVRSVVEAHSGSVSVVSEVGAGSTFVVRLPLFVGS
ncbi:MAG: HAMP domain-containing sensor histidine kinase [bacterium]|nr:HAMP domain-containing sensor histidine kinase [bacterium]